MTPECVTPSVLLVSGVSQVLISDQMSVRVCGSQPLVNTHSGPEHSSGRYGRIRRRRLGGPFMDDSVVPPQAVNTNMAIAIAFILRPILLNDSHY